MTTSLDRLCARIRKCRICVENPSGPPLPHEPRPVFQVSPMARVLIVGQAPGTRVHASGRPFTDASGNRLRQWLGISADIFYDPRLIALVPIGFCFPGQDAHGSDLPPRRECAPAWRKRLMKELKSIELVICLGLHAQRWHMDNAAPTLNETVKNWRKGLALAPAVIPMPHPSWRNTGWLQKNPWFERELLPVVKDRVHALLG